MYSLCDPAILWLGIYSTETLTYVLREIIGNSYTKNSKSYGENRIGENHSKPVEFCHPRTKKTKIVLNRDKKIVQLIYR